MNRYRYDPNSHKIVDTQTGRSVVDPAHSKTSKSTSEDIFQISEMVLNWRYWRNGPWPKGDTKTVFLRDAVLEVGRALFPDRWTGDEHLAASQLPTLPEVSPKPLPPAQEIEPDELLLKRGRQVAASGNHDMARQYIEDRLAQQKAGGEAAYRQLLADYQHARALAKQLHEIVAVNPGRLERLTAVIETIASWGRDEQLVTQLRHVDTSRGGGKYFDPPSPGVWNVEPVERARFWTCQFQCEMPGQRQLVPVYIFATRESLDECLKTIRRFPPSADANAGATKSGRTGRPKGVGGYDDTEIIQSMRAAVLERQLSPHAAAQELAENAKGASPNAKVQRLLGKYRKKFG